MADLADIQIGGYTFGRKRLSRVAKKYAVEYMRAHKSWLTAETRSPASEDIDAADLTKPVVLGQLLGTGGSSWFVLDGLPQVMKSLRLLEPIPLVRLSLRDTTHLIVAQPKGASGDGKSVRAKMRLARRDKDCSGCLGDF